MLDEEENFSYYKKVLENIFSNEKLFNDFKNFFTENSEKNIDNYISIIQRLISSRWKYIFLSFAHPVITRYPSTTVGETTRICD